MGESKLTASIKKIEIVNKTKKDEWQQSVRIILGDIELNNESFLALRKFRPDEMVHVAIDTAQMSLLPKEEEDSEAFGEDEWEEESEDLFTMEEGEETLRSGERVSQEFLI